jgi:hypothetical protein
MPLLRRNSRRSYDIIPVKCNDAKKVNAQDIKIAPY